MTTTSPAMRMMLGLVLLVLALAALRQVSSPDVGFHLEAGNHILSGKGWPATDPFTYTVTDHPYLDTSWGFQLLLSLTERVSGAPGMVLLHVALVLTLFWLVARTARLVPGESSVLLLLLLLGGIAAEPRFEVRPEMLSYTLLALVLYLLHRHAEGLGTRLWLLPPIFLLWVNVHGLFVLGWVAMGCFVVGRAFGRKRIDWPLVGWSVASVLVGLINPYGWRALAFPLQLATRMDRANVFARNIGEFFSPWAAIRSGQLTYYMASLACFVVFAALVALSARSLWRQRRYPVLMLCVVFLPLALTMIRNIPPMVVACLPGAVWGLSLDRVYDVLRLNGARRRWVRRAVVAGILLATVGLGLRLTTDAYYVSGRRPERFGLSWNEGALPVDAATWARDAGLPGRMLNHLNFGGYMMWALSEPVFIDGRLEVMGEEFFERYLGRAGVPGGARAGGAPARHRLDCFSLSASARPARRSLAPPRVAPGLRRSPGGDLRQRRGERGCRPPPKRRRARAPGGAGRRRLASGARRAGPPRTDRTSSRWSRAAADLSGRGLQPRHVPLLPSRPGACRRGLCRGDPGERWQIPRDIQQPRRGARRDRTPFRGRRLLPRVRIRRGRPLLT